jgi:hypothetical protein
MRHLGAILAVLLLLGGCTAGAATPQPASPVELPVASGAAAASASAGPAPSASVGRPGSVDDRTPIQSPVGVFNGRITFDGERCAYAGPTVIPSPATLRLEYAPTADQAGSMALFTPVLSETTQTDLDRVIADERYGYGTVNSKPIPEFMVYTMMGGISSSSVQDVPVEVRHMGRVYDKVAIFCITYPGMPAEGHFGPGAILQLVEQ